MLATSQIGVRPSRMSLIADVILLKQGESWYTEVIDISASGILVEHPQDGEYEIGDQFGIELILANGNTIALGGIIARIGESELAFEFNRIPPQSEVPLWDLLGQYADSMDFRT